jgi:hypothetical protein
MVKKGCWVRAEYDKDSQHLHPNRYAEKAEVGSEAANFRLIVTGEDLSGAEMSFYTTNSHPEAPIVQARKKIRRTDATRMECTGSSGKLALALNSKKN